jgi:ribosomal protein S18 acetylase RimI-like enzyme
MKQLTTRDGVALEVRPIRVADGPALASGFVQLSEATRHARFAAAKPRLTTRELEFLVDVDHHHHEALVAVDPSRGGIVAVARYVTAEEDPGSADIALTVSDRWQGRGIGGELTRRLLERAREEGIEQMTATVLADNVRSLRMLRTAGFAVTGRETGIIELGLEVEAPAPTAA